MNVFCELAVIGDRPGASGDISVVCHYRTPVTERAQILTRIKAERCGIAKRACLFSFISAPCAWAQSSTTFKEWRLAILMIASISVAAP
jgi:hypothetical protein